MSVFKKPKQEPKQAPQKNTEMQLKVSNCFQDKNKKECVLVTMKTNFYTLKVNAITAVLKLLFFEYFAREIGTEKALWWLLDCKGRQGSIQ